MPLSVFVALLIVYVLIAWLASAGLLWLCFVILRRRVGYDRCLLITSIQVPIGLSMVIVKNEGLAPWAELSLGLGGLVALYALIVTLGRASWKRSILVCLCFAVASIPLALGLAFGLAHRFMRAYFIPTASMAPTLEPGDRVIADVVTAPRRWDLIVFRAPIEPRVYWVKRLIGLPGETVEIVDNGIRINGVLTPKPAHLEWLHHDGLMRVGGQSGRGCTGSPMTLGPNEYFVLGDNTKQALDSRFWGQPEVPGPQPGAVPDGYIKGIVRIVYAPLGHARVLQR